MKGSQESNLRLEEKAWNNKGESNYPARVTHRWKHPTWKNVRGVYNVPAWCHCGHVVFYCIVIITIKISAHVFTTRRGRNVWLKVASRVGDDAHYDVFKIWPYFYGQVLQQVPAAEAAAYAARRPSYKFRITLYFISCKIIKFSPLGEQERKTSFPSVLESWKWTIPYRNRMFGFFFACFRRRRLKFCLKFSTHQQNI